MGAKVSNPHSDRANARRHKGKIKIAGVAQIFSLALLTVTLILLPSSTAYGNNFYWYGEGGSTCWQTGQLGSPSNACSNVAAGYLATPGHHAGGVLEFMYNVLEPGQDNLTMPSGDYCGYARLGDNLTLQDPNNEVNLTGFETPQPFSSWDESDGHGNVCQAVGANWGQEIQDSVAGNGCWTTCLMYHYVSLSNQGRNDQPWSRIFGEPSLVISAEADPHTFQVKGTDSGGVGNICALLEEKNTGRIISYCMQEWRGEHDGAEWQNERIAECGTDAGRVADMVSTFFWPGTSFASERSGSANTYVWKGYGGHHFEAAITRAEFTNAINLDNTEFNESGPNKSNTGGCSTPGHPRGFSTNPEEYALIAVEQGEEGWREVTELGEHTANLGVRTEFTPLKPEAITGTESSVQPLQATLKGSVNPEGIATRYYFKYGQTTAYGFKTEPEGNAGSGQSLVNESAVVNLEPGTTYHYRIVAVSEGGTEEGRDQEFTTPGPVEAVTAEASGILEEQAVLHGTVNPRGYDAKYYFEYGPTTTYGSDTRPEDDAGAGTTPVAENATITGLQSGKTYHYRIVATSGGIVSEGSDHTFRTSAAPSMIVAKGNVEAITGDPYNALYRTTSDFAQNTWLSALLGPVGTIESAPSSVADSGGDIWTAFEGVGNQLWVGVDTPSGGWGMSYEGPSNTTYSAPATAIDSNKNVWVAAEGPNHTLNLAEFSANKWVTSTPVTAADVYSAPSVVADSGGDIWVAFQGPGNQLWVGVDSPTGGWGMSYEGPSSTTYSAPSAVIDSSGNIWIGAEGSGNTLAVTVRSKTTGTWGVSYNGMPDSASVNNTPSLVGANGGIAAATQGVTGALYLTTSDFAQNTWLSALLGPVGTIESAPSSVADSGGDIWTAFEGVGNQLWVGVDTPSGGWGMSYEGPSNTTYSAPATAIDSNKNVWVAAEGPNHTLNLAEFSANKWVTSTPVTAADVYSAPSVVADSGGDIWVAFQGPGNQLWVGVDSPTGGWGMSYEGPSSTTYSAPSAVIDSSGNIWIGAEGSGNTLAVTVRSKTTGTWEVSFQGG
jgi:hypothetical protein